MLLKLLYQFQDPIRLSLSSFSRLRFSSCLADDFFCKANMSQLINAPTTAPKAMLRYVLDAFAISAQPFVISGMHPQIAIALINMQCFWVLPWISFAHILAPLFYQTIKERKNLSLYMNDHPPSKSNNAWSLGSYSEVALFFLPVSAHLVRLCDISSGDHILDVACGTGNTAITAARTKGAKVTGIDFTPEMLTQAKMEADLAGTEDIEWKEGDVEDLPFEDESFDVVLSSFGHMFAPNPEVAIKEMLRVTKSGGRIAFATWPPEHANGRMFDAMAKHIPNLSSSSNSPIPPPSPMQWGSPDVVKKRLGGKVIGIHFERGAIKKPVLSPNHYWQTASTKGGTLIQAIQELKDPQKVEDLKRISCRL